MRSYLVLTPPRDAKSGPDRDHRSTLVLRDGFSWAALVLPWLWLFWRGLWISGFLVLAAQIAGFVLIAMEGLTVVGALLLLTSALLVALEGRHYHGEMLVRRGWRLETVLFAPDLTTAETIYFAGLPVPEKAAMPAVGDWARNTQAAPTGGWQGFGPDLFDHGGR